MIFNSSKGPLPTTSGKQQHQSYPYLLPLQQLPGPTRTKKQSVVRM